VSAPHHCATPNQEEYSSVSEPQRLALYRAVQAALGEEEGNTLMALTPPANTDIATRQDVEHAQALMSAQLGEMAARMDARIERMGTRTLRWTVGTLLAGNAAVVALITLILR
jgi:hypothetical protein